MKLKLITLTSFMFLGYLTLFWGCNKGVVPEAPASSTFMSIKVPMVDSKGKALVTTNYNILYSVTGSGSAPVTGMVGPVPVSSVTGTYTFSISLVPTNYNFVALQFNDASSNQVLAVGGQSFSFVASQTLPVTVGPVSKNCYQVTLTPGNAFGFENDLTTNVGANTPVSIPGYDVVCNQAGSGYVLQNPALANNTVAYMGNGNWVNFLQVPPSSSFFSGSGQSKGFVTAGNSGSPASYPVAVGDVYCVKILSGGYAWLQVTSLTNGVGFEYRPNTTQSYCGYEMSAADQNGTCGANSIGPPYLITGTITYTGTKSLTGQYFEVYVAPNFGSNSKGAQVSVPAASSAPYTVTLPGGPASVVMAVLLSPTNNSNNGGNQVVGESYGVWNNTNLAGTNGAPVTIVVSGPMTINPSFGDTYTFGGVTGTINFTGAGEVSNDSPLQLVAYADSAYMTPVSGGSMVVTTNNSSYNYGMPVTNSSVYLQAFYGQGNNGNGPATCAPVTNLGLVTVNPPTTGYNITLSDTNLFACAGGESLSGTVTYAVSGAAVNASDPIVVRAYNSSDSPIASCPVTTNGGSYFLGLPTQGSYYLTEEYVANPGAAWQTGNYAVGSYVENSDGSCTSSGPGPAISVGNAAVSNLTFNNTCAQLTGFTGSLTYTGVYGNNGLYVMAVTQTAEDSENGPSSGVNGNGGTYNIQASGSYYLRVWYDVSGNSCAGNNGCLPQTGDPWNVYGPYNASTGQATNLSFPGSQTW